MALLRPVATVGGYTMLSRLLGFVREVLTAAFLGAGPVSDAFFVALRLPNMFRSLFAEGAFSAGFVPIFASKIAGDGRPAAKLFAEDALAVLLAALLVFVIAGEWAAPWILHVLAPGFLHDPAKFALTVELTRIMFPYLLYISLVALLGGVLNSVDRFAAMAVTPALLNLFLIAALTLVRPLTGQALAWAVMAAGLAQFLWLMVACRQAGLPLSLPRPRLTPEVRRLLRVMLPAVFGAGVTQVNLLISTAVASLLPTGSVSYLNYADRLNQLPLAVVGIAIGTAILPALSRHVRADNELGAQETQNRGLELALLLTLPAAAAFTVTATPLLHVLFERGAFGAREVAATAPALGAYALGLPAFVLIKVLAPGFFARHDTATPVRIAAAAVAVNAVMTLLLGFVLPFAHVGVAFATTIAGWVNALLLMLVLHRRGHFTVDARARRAVPRIVAAAFGMAVLLALLQIPLAGPLDGGVAARFGALAALIGAGLLGFAVLAFAVGAADWREVARRFKREAA